MTEKTLRYPGHADAMRTLRQSGFFDTGPIEAGSVCAAPRVVTERLLSRAWKLREGEREFTFLRVAVSGRDGAGVSRRYSFELLDRTDPADGTTSMARSTGFPCAAVAAMLARREYRDPGIRPPEFLAKDPVAAARLLEALRARGLLWKERFA